MKKAMVFIDYENFEIARRNLYSKNGGDCPRLDIAALPRKVVDLIGDNLELVKTFLFIPKPDDTLMQQEWRRKNYDFLKGLENVDYFTVISGSHRVKRRYGLSACIRFSEHDWTRGCGRRRGRPVVGAV